LRSFLIAIIFALSLILAFVGYKLTVYITRESGRLDFVWLPVSAPVVRGVLSDGLGRPLAGRRISCEGALEDDEAVTDEKGCFDIEFGGDNHPVSLTIDGDDGLKLNFNWFYHLAMGRQGVFLLITVDY